MPTRTVKRARRARGQGTVVHRKDGRWAAFVPMANGKRVPRYAKTEAEAELLRQQLVAERDGERMPVNSLRLGGFLHEWLETLGRRLRPVTVAGYRYAVESALVCLGDVLVADISVRDVERWLTDVGRERSDQTVKNYRAALRAALQTAVRWQLVAQNVAALTEGPTVRRRDPTVLDATETRRFLEVARAHRLEALFVVGAHTGMRLSEILGLAWSDIDLEARSLTVRSTLSREGGSFVLRDPKTARSARPVPLSDDCVAALIGHRERQADEWRAQGLPGDRPALAFTTVTGQPLHRSTVSHLFHRLLDDANCERVRFHDLRHGVATMLLQQGVAAKVVQEILGHSTIAITLDLYTHVTRELSHDAMARMQEALRS